MELKNSFNNIRPGTQGRTWDTHCTALEQDKCNTTGGNPGQTQVQLRYLQQLCAKQLGSNWSYRSWGQYLCDSQADNPEFA